MAMTAGQFFLYLLIIIILKESLASAASVSSDSLLMKLEESENIVTISWTNVETPSEFNWLGMCNSLDFSGHRLESSVSGWQTGDGSSISPTGNVRAPYVFVSQIATGVALSAALLVAVLRNTIESL